MCSYVPSLVCYSSYKARVSFLRESFHTSEYPHTWYLLPPVNCLLPPYRRLVLPGGMVMVEFPLRPQREGTFTLLASMHCDQLTDVRGWKEVVVTK